MNENTEMMLTKNIEEKGGGRKRETRYGKEKANKE